MTTDPATIALREAVARLIHPTAFQLRDELERTVNARHILTGEPVPASLREPATKKADEQCAIAFDKADAVIDYLRSQDNE